MPSVAGEDEIKKLVMEDPVIGKWIEGRSPKKIIIVLQETFEKFDSHVKRKWMSFMDETILIFGLIHSRQKFFKRLMCFAHRKLKFAMWQI